MLTSLGSVRCPLLIGRDDLLELAARRLDDVIAGRGQFLLLAGEAGIGKTRFLAAIRHMAEDRGLRGADGAVAPQDRNVPASSILDLARTMTRIAPLAGLGRELLDLRTTTLAAEHVRRRGLALEIVDLILGSLPGPTMLSFWDLQWADDLSLEIIGEMARRSRDRPLLLTGDYRTEDVPPGSSLRAWRSRLITQRMAEELRLGPLSAPETALVTSLILDTGLPAPREVANAVYERTDGIPLHIEELLGALSADARADGTAIREATVPDTIEDAVLARMAHLSPEAQAAAGAGAIIGRSFSLDVLAGIMDLPPGALDEPLQELVDNVVLEAPGERGLYDFRHQLLRDVLYRTIPAAERRRFHARAGEFGAQLEGASEIHASVHYERAGLRRQAFEAAVAGAREASQMSAHRDSFELYARAVANMPNDLADADRGALFDAYALEATTIEGYAIAEPLWDRARDSYAAAGMWVKAAETRIAVLYIWRREARSFAKRRALAEELDVEIERLPAGEQREMVHHQLLAEWARIHLESLDLDAARATIRDMRRSTEISGDDGGDVMENDLLEAQVDILEGDLGAGFDTISESAYGARDAGYENVALTSFRDGSVLAFRMMDRDRADRLLDDGVRYAESTDQSHCRNVMAATSGLQLWANGEWTAAAQIARQTIADHGSRRSVVTARWAVGYVALGRGTFSVAETELGSALAVGEESGTIDLILPPLWGLAEAALLADQPDRAAEHCRRALESARASGERALLVPFVVTGVRAEQAAGRPSGAAAWLQACAEHLAPLPAVAGPALDHARGLVAMAAGSTVIARVALEAAVRGWTDRGRVWEATWARLDLAECLGRLNRFTDSMALTVEARATASRLDSRPLAQRADVLHRNARGRVPAEEPWRPLTAREFAVARLISEGLTNGEIASELSIAPKTASSHVEHILAKLGASRRAEIAAWATAVVPAESRG
jgi:DNA-binding CsgD family transcriptional regulator